MTWVALAHGRHVAASLALLVAIHLAGSALAHSHDLEASGPPTGEACAACVAAASPATPAAGPPSPAAFSVAYGRDARPGRDPFPRTDLLHHGLPRGPPAPAV